MKPHIKPIFSKFDGVHVFDGLFVPTAGKTRNRLFIDFRLYNNIKVKFIGFEQLGADDQSVMLAICAQLGIDHLLLNPNSGGSISKQLHNDLSIKPYRNDTVITTETSLRSLMIDAGYCPKSSVTKIKKSLERLRNAQIIEEDQSGWNRSSNLISAAFNNNKVYVAVNPRLSSILCGQQTQHVRISLIERNALESEVAKILHCWLSSYVKQGQMLGHNSAHVDTLMKHVWGVETYKASHKVQCVRRAQLVNALDEIDSATNAITNNNGWEIKVLDNMAYIKRPKMPDI